MRAKEFIRENTTSGSIAVVAQPMGMLSRAADNKTAKYANSFVTTKRKKSHAR